MVGDLKQAVPEHLGGYVPGGDEATWFPDLWRFCVEDLKVSSVLDIGCGEGHSTRYFRELGCKVVAVDGVDTGVPNPFFVHDFTEGPILLRKFGPRFSLGWCCEFLEHVEERYVRNVVQSLRSCDMVMLTHAEPGQAGHHHVNCRDVEYWRGFMVASGFLQDRILTTITRRLAARNPSPWNHYARSGMVFVQA